MAWAKTPFARFRFLAVALALAGLFSAGLSRAQATAPRAMIKLHGEGSPAPRATIADMAWIEGHWIGEMPDGPVEHVVLSPRFGHLPGFVRALGDRAPVFYEISVFAEQGDSLTVRVKHFTPELAGWEAQSEYVARPLVNRDATNFYFDGITFSRTGPDSFTVYFLNRSEGKERETLVIPFRRKPAPAAGDAGLPAKERVAAAHSRLREAMLANDPSVLALLYRPDAMSMPDYQPALHGTAQIAAYHRVLGQRRQVSGYVPVTSEIFDLGKAIVEIGTFTINWSLPTGAKEEERGKYVHIWGVEADGSLRLKSDVRGYFRRLPNPAAFFVDLPQGDISTERPSAADPELERTLRARNMRNAEAVRNHDAEAKIADYADDAVIMPFADTNKTGIGEIRPYLIAYTEAGRGVTFDTVRVWNVGFEDFGTYVIEYPKFQVNWRSSDVSGVVKGGGLRLWRRRADGSLALFRQIGTHDYP